MTKGSIVRLPMSKTFPPVPGRNPSSTTTAGKSTNDTDLKGKNLNAKSTDGEKTERKYHGPASKSTVIERLTGIA